MSLSNGMKKLKSLKDDGEPVAVCLKRGKADRLAKLRTRRKEAERLF